ncbi:MAG: hypothetical protein J7L22_05210 [Candidatus Marinimicrobia bacterium]|nr:hypothetical protein [Candidatus Neomarinimicrobiota bacterium]
MVSNLRYRNPFPCERPVCVFVDVGSSAASYSRSGITAGGNEKGGKSTNTANRSVDVKHCSENQKVMP